MSNRRPEPRRVPKQPAASSAERFGAGCLGLIVLPWFLTSMFGSFVASVELPLQGIGGIFAGMMSLLIFLPLAIVLGSVSMSAISRAFGSKEPIRLAHRASAGVAITTIVLFALASAATLFTAGAGMMQLLGVAAVVATIAAITSFARRSSKRTKPQRKRRSHQRPPKPPWQHPLARTEQTNLYAEALVDEINIVAILAATALSILLANPIPLLTAGGLELIYLALVPDTEWFRRRVDNKHLAMAHDQASERREEQREFLAFDQLQRHERLIEQVERARETLSQAAYGFDESKLEQAVDHHLWLMQLENYYTDLDTPGRLRDLDKRIDAARADIDGVDGRMLEVLERRLEVLERRREQFEEMEARAQEVADKRRILEETLPLITESALAGQVRIDDLDEVLFDLQVTEDVVLELHDADDALEAEIEEAYAEATV